MVSTYQELQDKKWKKHFDELLKFQKKTGNHYPKPNDGWSSLYNWAKNQRRLYRTGKLMSQRLKMLESAHFPWKTENMSFEDRVRQLLQYKKKHGTEYRIKIDTSKVLNTKKNFHNKIDKGY